LQTSSIEIYLNLEIYRCTKIQSVELNELNLMRIDGYQKFDSRLRAFKVVTE